MQRSVNYFQAMRQRHIGEINDGLSETIPGQAISAPELLRRFATGQPLGFKNVTPVYDDDDLDPVPEFYKLNKLDRLHILQENSERIKTAKETLSVYQRIEQQQKQQQQQQNEQKEVKKESEQQPTKKSGSSQATT